MPRIVKKMANNSDPARSVPKRVTRYHPALRAAIAVKNTLSDAGDGLLHACSGNGCALIVSPKNWRRALRISHTVLIALQKAGHQILPESEWQPGLVVEVHGHRVAFDIREALRQVRRRHKWSDSVRVDLEPKGLLNFRLFRRSHGWPAETTVAEREGFPLEEQIDHIVARFELVALRMEQSRQWQEAREKEWRMATRRKERRQTVINRRKELQASLESVVASVRLLEQADQAAAFLRDAYPNSRRATRLANWIERTRKKLASPSHIARSIQRDDLRDD